MLKVQFVFLSKVALDTCFVIIFFFDLPLPDDSFKPRVVPIVLDLSTRARERPSARDWLISLTHFVPTNEIALSVDRSITLLQNRSSFNRCSFTQFKQLFYN